MDDSSGRVLLNTSFVEKMKKNKKKTKTKQNKTKQKKKNQKKPQEGGEGRGSCILG